MPSDLTSLGAGERPHMDVRAGCGPGMVVAIIFPYREELKITSDPSGINAE